jgi:Type VI secretion system/phage-baseplate injector OB domain
MQDILDRTVEKLVERVGSTYYGKYRGIVSDVADPENRCRIRATVPAVLGEQVCGWAMPALPWAGNGHGVVMLPAVGSGVWIEFEAGRLNNPIWSGAWWASGQRPEPQGDAVRVIVSEQGHSIVMDDDKNELTITHGGGPSIKLTATEILLVNGSCELRIGARDISLNNGLIKVGLAGASLVNGAMSLGTPP